MSEWLLFALIFFAGGVAGALPVAITTIARIEVLKAQLPGNGRVIEVPEVIATAIVVSLFWVWLWFGVLNPSNWKKA